MALRSRTPKLATILLLVCLTSCRVKFDASETLESTELFDPKDDAPDAGRVVALTEAILFSPGSHSHSSEPSASDSLDHGSDGDVALLSGASLGGSKVERLDWLDTMIVPRFADETAGQLRSLVHVELPRLANEPFRLLDQPSGVWVEVTLEGADAVLAERAGDYVVYRNAYGVGAHILHHPRPDGTEDFAVFEQAPITPSLRYSVALGEDVAGLRLVANTLE